MALYDIHPRIKAGAVERIKGLALPGDAIFGSIDQRVYSMLLPDETGVLFPCVMLTCEGQVEQKLQGDSECQRWRYPVQIWICDRQSERTHEKETLYLSWRKRICLTFDDQTFPEVAEAEGSTIELGTIFDTQMRQYQHMLSGMVLWVTTTEQRGAP
jgi:hypothetical protein